ncbi:MAG: sulfotransferase domain-containing protein [Chloroflexi bacterium]|nr:sulfotransferase domain-containing protein [Chloroflexota bacterium]MCI0727413.1 sulfotransferase domain-containing protein [Chloroflexota bacterium]
MADVFLVSFPKCGRTWLRLMIGRVFQLHFQLPESNLLDLEGLSDLQPDIPRIRVTHEDGPLWKRAEQLSASKERYKDKKVIFLVRDPRDVIPSAYFHKSKRKLTYNCSLSEFLYEPVGSLNSLLAYYKIWYENRHVPQAFLLVRYEDLHTHAHQELRRVIDFIGIQGVDDDAIATAVAFASFDNMRQMERSGLFNSGVMRPKDKEDEESYKTRKGKVGGFVDYFDESEVAFVNQRIREDLPDLFGYSDYNCHSHSA